MNLLTRVAEIVGLKSSFLRQAAPSDSRNIDTGSFFHWADDSTLRKLAADSDAGLTKWVLASDMSEFFKKLDAYNEGRSFREKVFLRVSTSAANYLACVIDKKAHFPQEVIEGNKRGFDIRDLGPKNIGPEYLLVQQGNKRAYAAYHADPHNSNLNIETSRGWLKLEFGMGEDPLQHVPAPTLSLAVK